MSASLSVHSVEGKPLEAVPAEAIEKGDIIVAGGPGCGILDLYEVKEIAINEERNLRLFKVEDQYESHDYITADDDRLVVRVAHAPVKPDWIYKK